MAIDPTTPSTVYVAIASLAGVYKSTNGGDSWMLMNNGLSGAVTINALAINPSVTGTVYAGAIGGVFKTADGGSTWVKKNNGLSISVYYLAIDPQTPSSIYAAGFGVYKSTNSGDTWSSSNSGLPDLNTHTIVIDPINSSNVYVATNSGVAKSTNGGTNWIGVSSGLGNESVSSSEYRQRFGP